MNSVQETRLCTLRDECIRVLQGGASTNGIIAQEFKPNATNTAAEISWRIQQKDDLAKLLGVSARVVSGFLKACRNAGVLSWHPAAGPYVNRYWSLTVEYGILSSPQSGSNCQPKT